MRWGIDLFIEDGAYTTLAAAVTILVVLTLLFSSLTATWSMSRAGDVQVSADATALAGANVVSSYCTAATVMDACVLSLGLAGFITSGTGLVLTLIPGAEAAGAETLHKGIQILKTRNKFSQSVGKALMKLEKALPAIIAANGTKTCMAQTTDAVAYMGTAIPVPWKSDSDFGALEEDVETDELEEAGEKLEESAQEMQEAAKKTAEAKEEAWRADCGKAGKNMQERAASLSGLSAMENPDYQSSVSWQPKIALNRARAYYRWRLSNEKPKNSSTEEKANSAARRAFYQFACDELRDAAVELRGDHVVSTVPLLPRNTEEIRQSSLYRRAMWPSTIEDRGVTLHYGTDCPGAKGDAGSQLSLADVELGNAVECPECAFGVGDVGKTPAASTSIDNGFEYHLRAFTQALDAYVECRNRELELERQTKDEAENAGNVFQDIADELSVIRPKIAPPGRYGCIGVVGSGEIVSPELLETDFSEAVELGERGAVSAAALARDEATLQNNVLASFFSSLERNAVLGGVAGILGAVMDLWGVLLVGYSAAGEGLTSLFDQFVAGAGGIGLGPIATFLQDLLGAAIEGLGLQPVDMSLKKPVLTDTTNVLARSDIPSLSNVQSLVRRIPVGTTDPGDIVEALTYMPVAEITSYEFSLGEIEFPWGGSIPLTIRVKDVIEAVGG